MNATIPLHRPPVYRQDMEKLLSFLLPPTQENSGNTEHFLCYQWERALKKSYGASHVWAFRDLERTISYVYEGLNLGVGDEVYVSVLANPLYLQLARKRDARVILCDTEKELPVICLPEVESSQAAGRCIVIADAPHGLWPSQKIISRFASIVICDDSDDFPTAPTMWADYIVRSSEKNTLLSSGGGGVCLSRKKLLDAPPSHHRLGDVNAALALAHLHNLGRLCREWKKLTNDYDSVNHSMPSLHKRNFPFSYLIYTEDVFFPSVAQSLGIETQPALRFSHHGHALRQSFPNALHHAQCWFELPFYPQLRESEKKRVLRFLKSLSH